MSYPHWFIVGQLALLGMFYVILGEMSMHPDRSRNMPPSQTDSRRKRDAKIVLLTFLFGVGWNAVFSRVEILWVLSPICFFLLADFICTYRSLDRFPRPHAQIALTILMFIVASQFFFIGEYHRQHATFLSETLLAHGKVPPKPFPILLQIGNSATFVKYGEQGDESTKVLEGLLSDAGIHVDAGANGPELSTIVRDRNSKAVVTVNRNVWTVSPSVWDKNYTTDRLEVLDDRDHVVLQVHVLPDRVKIQGEWRDGYGNGWAFLAAPNGVGMIMLKWTKEEPHHIYIEPMFEYPSSRNLGKLRPNAF
jgi:hypothetical protein